MPRDSKFSKCLSDAFSIWITFGRNGAIVERDSPACRLGQLDEESFPRK